MKSMNLVRCTVVILTLVSFASDAIADDAIDVTTQSAVRVLRKCFQPDRQGQYKLMIAALRQLQDPQLAPLFSDLANSDDPILKIHGVLGISEISDHGKLDLVRLTAIYDVMLQSEIVSAAMRDDLLTDDQAKELLDWPGLDIQIKVLVATQLVEHGKFDDVKILTEALDSDVPGVRHWSAMLLTQLGGEKGEIVLEEIDDLAREVRDRTYLLLLGQAYLSDFDKLGGWAIHIYNQENIDRFLKSLAMKVALRFNVDNAQEIWQEIYTGANDDATKRRLAIELLEVSPWVNANMFSPLQDSDDQLIKQIGDTGKAVAENDSPAKAVAALVDTGHKLCLKWAMDWAVDNDNNEDAALVFRHLINSYDQKQSSSHYASFVMQASEELFTRDPEQATVFLRKIIASPQSPRLLKQYILLGLINCQNDKPNRVCEGLPPFDNDNSQALRVLLDAKHSDELQPKDMQQLMMIVRGGSVNSPALRVQGAWVFLRLTKQTHPALAKTLAGG